ncbi:unnamed protein product [Rotaria sp. Silwood1]|nr:unnamed protein product [Rotaria sp. Silwood1]CAF1635772.1 unnamed protein product [Rotaria sp. Silwood1]
MEGAKQGIVVAGGQGKGDGLTQLSSPQGVVVDPLGTVYVADWGNDRIMRWPQGATQGSVIVGGNGKGGQSNQLNWPIGLSFDRDGNLYVVDLGNDRVQKFNIESNNTLNVSRKTTVNVNDIATTQNYVIIPRSYQTELVEQAKDENLIVCLPTGSGKTYIAVMLIKEMARETLALVQQQSDYIRIHTDLTVGNYYGALGVDSWSKEQWLDEFENHQVLVFTAQVFLNLVEHNYFPLYNVNLLIFDECQHSTGGSCYPALMKRYNECHDPPRILGLTASISAKKLAPHQLPNAVQQIEQTYKARVASGSNREESNRYGTSVRLEPICCLTYQDQIRNDQESIKIPFETIQSIVDDLKSYLSEQKAEREKIEQDLVEVILMTDYLGENLTEYSARSVDYTIFLQSEYVNLPRLKYYLENLLYTGYELGIYGFFLACKALQRTLKSSRALELITDEKGKALSSVGSTAMTARYQRQTIKAFRAGEINVLVATAVVEEGLDIPKCNLVFRFNRPPNFSSYMQSKGRARAKQNASRPVNASKLPSTGGYYTVQKELKNYLNANKIEVRGQNANWLPSGYMIVDTKSIIGQRYAYQIAKRKAFSDMIEAFIGAFLISTNYTTTIQFMHWLGLCVIPVAKSPSILRSNIGSTNEDEISEIMNKFFHDKAFDEIETMINYTFQSKAYLIAAFTHPSSFANRLTDCYERLEFLGDAILDFLVTRYVFVHYNQNVTPGKHYRVVYAIKICSVLLPGRVTDIRQDLSNNDRLAYILVACGLHRKILHNSPDLFGHITAYAGDEDVFPKDQSIDQYLSKVFTL